MFSLLSVFLDIVLSILRITASDCPFGILKFSNHHTNFGCYFILVLCFVVVLFYTCNNCFVEVSKLNYDPKTVLCVKALFMDSFFKNAQETVGDFR